MFASDEAAGVFWYGFLTMMMLFPSCMHFSPHPLSGVVLVIVTRLYMILLPLSMVIQRFCMTFMATTIAVRSVNTFGGFMGNIISFISSPSPSIFTMVSSGSANAWALVSTLTKAVPSGRYFSFAEMPHFSAG